MKHSFTSSLKENLLHATVKHITFKEFDYSFDDKVSVEVLAWALNNRTFQERWIYPETDIIWQLTE